MRLKTAMTPRLWRALRTLVFGAACQDGKPRVGKAKHFEGAQSVFGDWQAVFANPGFGLDDLADTGKEPRIEGCDYLDVFVGQTVRAWLGR